MRAAKLGITDVDAKCSREVAKQMLDVLDDDYMKKLQARVEYQVSRGGRRSEKKKKDKRSVGEVYSPPRITQHAEEYGLKPTFALDLTVTDEVDGVPWDFNEE